MRVGAWRSLALAFLLIGAPRMVSADDATRSVPWSVKTGASVLDLTWNRSLTFVVAGGNSEAKQIKVLDVALVDSTTNARIDTRDVRVCSAEDSACNGAFDVPAHASAAARLQILNEFALPGKFAGNITLVSADGNSSALALTVFSSPYRSRWIGAACLTLGIAISFFVTRWARQLSQRAQDLIPAAELQDTIRALQSELAAYEKQLSATLSKIKTELAALEAELAPTALGSLIASAAPSFYPVADHHSEYQQYLTQRSNRVATLSVLIREGVRRAAAQNDPAVAAKIDSLVPNVTSPDDARAKVTALWPAAEHAALLGAHPAEPGSRVRELRLEIATINVAATVIWSLLTLAAGVAALILANGGFGTPADYMKCIFWGAGVPLAGQQLQQLTPGAVSTALSVAIPK